MPPFRASRKQKLPRGGMSAIQRGRLALKMIYENRIDDGPGAGMTEIELVSSLQPIGVVKYHLHAMRRDGLVKQNMGSWSMTPKGLKRYRE